MRKFFEMKKNLAFGEKNYNYYGVYLKQKFNGQKVYKVIVDAGFTCPNREIGRASCRERV